MNLLSSQLEESLHNSLDQMLFQKNLIPQNRPLVQRKFSVCQW